MSTGPLDLFLKLESVVSFPDMGTFNMSEKLWSLTIWADTEYEKVPIFYFKIKNPKINTSCNI